VLYTCLMSRKDKWQGSITALLAAWLFYDAVFGSPLKGNRPLTVALAAIATLMVAQVLARASEEAKNWMNATFVLLLFSPDLAEALAVPLSRQILLATALAGGLATLLWKLRHGRPANG
jgi:hypothetical protein